MKERYELPVFSVLERICQTARAEVNTRHYDQLYRLLDAESRQCVTDILKASTSTNGFGWSTLKNEPKRPTPRYAVFKKRFLAEFRVSFDAGEVLSRAKPINWKLIQSEWENIVKIMLSLGRRTVQQSTLVKKLCG